MKTIYYGKRVGGNVCSTRNGNDREKCDGNGKKNPHGEMDYRVRCRRGIRRGNKRNKNIYDKTGKQPYIRAWTIYIYIYVRARLEYLQKNKIKY